MSERGDGFVKGSASLEETAAIGAAIGAVLEPGLVIGLVGPLGAGKTHLVKGMARGNGLDDPRGVTSPTFTLVHEYPGRARLIHIDVYRLKAAGELTALGFDEMVETSAVVVEWADRVEDQLPADRLWIEIEVSGETRRTFRFRATGDVAARVLGRIHEGLSIGD